MENAVSWIRRNKFSRIALQFPKGEISLAPALAESLSKLLPSQTQIFVLGDTSYGDCCVDEVGAEHYCADCIIHYGYSCQNNPLRLPTFCLFPELEISRIDLETWAKVCVKRNLPILVLADPSFKKSENFAIAELCAAGASQIYIAPTSQVLRPLSGSRADRAREVSLSGISTLVSACVSPQSSFRKFNRKVFRYDSFLKPVDSLPDEIIIFFVGPRNSPILARAILSQPDGSVFCAGVWLSAGREIARKFAGVESVKKSTRVGVLYAASALRGVQRVRDVLSSALRAKEKIVCGFCVGKLTDAKIGNFTEIDCFVVLGCPDFLNSELLTSENSRNFHCPLVSAFEAAVATDLIPWLGRGACEFSELEMPGLDLEIASSQITDLIKVTSRGYSGLEFTTKTEPAKIEEGLSGVPSRYISEPSTVLAKYIKLQNTTTKN